LLVSSQVLVLFGLEYKMSIEEKLFDLPLGVILSLVVIIATAFVVLLGAIALILGTHPSLVLLISMLVFTVIRLIYFAFTKK
jgi:hypothetical protein